MKRNSFSYCDQWSKCCTICPKCMIFSSFLQLNT